jgi:ribosomal-protein-alanine N-acetyltransferase
MQMTDIVTERLRLRMVQEKDLDTLYALRSNPSLMKYIPRPLMNHKIGATEFLAKMLESIQNNTAYNWSVTMLGNDTAIGLMGYYRLYPENFRAELGYMLLPEYHSQGIMQEALLGMVKYGFEKMKLHTIEAVIDPRNMASKKVLEKTGFVKEAHFKENIFFEGKFLDSVHYTLFGNQ